MKGARAPRVLVTGVTGFLGAAVVRRLLAGGEPVTVLARARDGRSGAARAAVALGLTRGTADLEVVEGDLAEPVAGLAAVSRRRLRDEVATVINCAGETVFFPEYPDRFRAGHVEGPLGLLEWLAEGRLTTWAQVSTAYVCGRRTGVVLETDGDVGQALHNPYERVKLEAETALRVTGARRHLDVRILRPSAVIGRAGDTAGSAPSSLFVRFVRMVAALADLAQGAPVPLRIEAAPQARFNVVPLSFVSRSIALLARCREGENRTFHLVVSDALRQDAVLGLISARLRLSGFVLVREGGAPLSTLSPLERRVRVMLGRYRDYLTHDVRFDDTNTRQALARHGLGPATLRQPDLHRLIDLALRGRPVRTR